MNKIFIHFFSAWEKQCVAVVHDKRVTVTDAWESYSCQWGFTEVFTSLCVEICQKKSPQNSICSFFRCESAVRFWLNYKWMDRNVISCSPSTSLTLEVGWYLQLKVMGLSTESRQTKSCRNWQDVKEFELAALAWLVKKTLLAWSWAGLAPLRTSFSVWTCFLTTQQSKQRLRAHTHGCCTCPNTHISPNAQSVTHLSDLNKMKWERSDSSFPHLLSLWSFILPHGSMASRRRSVPLSQATPFDERWHSANK